MLRPAEPEKRSSADEESPGRPAGTFTALCGPIPHTEETSAREHSWHRWLLMALKQRVRREHGRNPVTSCDNLRGRRKHEA